MERELIIREFSNHLTIERSPDIVLNHKFLGFRTFKSECKVEIWKLKDKAIVLFTDTGNGTSVTNASGQLVTEIYNQYLIKEYKTNQCLFAETYDKVEKGIDVIVTEWDGNKVINNSWFHLGKIVK